MARKPRQHVENGFYHVTMRGNHGQCIFHCMRDYELLENIVSETLERTAASVHAYCWMTNHIHLIVRVRTTPLGVSMQRICTKFARIVQSRLSTTGHLFERRYFARLVDVDAYLLQAIRYVHLNPVNGGLVVSPDEYRWSSHGDYLGRRRRQWVQTSFALRMLHEDEPRARAIYRKFVLQGLGDAERMSDADWNTRETESREQVSARAALLPPPTREPPLALKQIITGVCQELGLAAEDLSCASTSRRLVAARAEVARRAIDRRVASLSDIARQFNRSVAALSRAVDRRRRNPDV